VKCRWPTSDELGMQKTRRACGNRMEYVNAFTGKTGEEMGGALNWVTVVGNNCLLVLLVFNLQILLSHHNYKMLLYYTIE